MNSRLTINVPAKLSARLRSRLAELELPESCLLRVTHEFLASLLEDDDLLTTAWVYRDRKQAERVARRIFARAGRPKRRELTFGNDEKAVVFLNPRADAHDRNWWPKLVAACLRNEPDRHVLLKSG